MTRLSFSSMTRDGVGNLTGLSASVPADTSLSGTSSWTHDSKDRLTNETTTRGADWNHAFGYDNAFNPTSWRGNTRTYNTDNQETTGTNQFVYDGNGNPTTYGGVTTTWSFEYRPSAIHQPKPGSPAVRQRPLTSNTPPAQSSARPP